MVSNFCEELSSNTLLSDIEDVLILFQLDLNLLSTRQVIPARLIADEEVAVIKLVSVPAEEVFRVVLAVIALLTGLLHEVTRKDYS